MNYIIKGSKHILEIKITDLFEQPKVVLLDNIFKNKKYKRLNPLDPQLIVSSKEIELIGRDLKIKDKMIEFIVSFQKYDPGTKTLTIEINQTILPYTPGIVLSSYVTNITNSIIKELKTLLDKIDYIFYINELLNELKDE